MRFPEFPSIPHAGGASLDNLLRAIKRGRDLFAHSIRTRITALTLAAILVSVLSIGGISIYSIKLEGDRDSLEKLTLICDNRRRKLNEYLDSIEQSVEMVSRYAGEELSSVELMSGGVIGANGYGDNPLWSNRDEEQRRQLDRYLKSHTADVETVFRSVSNHTNGVLTYYYRINPELSDSIKGFWYSRGETGQFMSLEPTDILNYDRDDKEHVGFYFIPLRRGRPSWLEPYYNANLDTVITSYAIPIYKAGTFIGVIGMDISYQTLVTQLESVQIYQEGYACLLEEDGTVLYHPFLEHGLNLEEEEPALAGLSDWLKSADSSKGGRLYTYRGTEWLMVFHTLANDMKLVAAAPMREINANWLSLVHRIALTAAILLLLFAGVMFYLMNRITEPLLRLTNASRLLAEGNYDVELDYTGKDEVGILTGAFQSLVNHLRVYISDLNSRAYQDAMTGVKNKGAFNISAKQIDDTIRLAGLEETPQPEFAIVMLDCNNLKKINDRYGHDKGDIYLQTACALICRVFSHSPVFRMGGDEFTVILQKEDYHSREVLFTHFARLAGETTARAENAWEEINIAKGMAAYDPLTDGSVENVLHRADELMYLDKQRMKRAAPR